MPGLDEWRTPAESAHPDDLRERILTGKPFTPYQPSHTWAELRTPPFDLAVASLVLQHVDTDAMPRLPPRLCEDAQYGVPASAPRAVIMENDG